jgi:hypothetical protein
VSSCGGHGTDAIPEVSIARESLSRAKAPAAAVIPGQPGTSD